MKKTISLLSIISIISVLQISPLAPPAQAHELLPPDLIELIRTNPELTAEQLEAYMEQHETQSGSATEILGVKDESASTWQVITTFSRLGIEHILIGTDHILFVLALLLVFGSWWHILRMVTSFTIAHSITLILAGSGFFALSGRIVEPLIALSISYMAISTVFFPKSDVIKTERTKVITVFLFGLFHGLGFAGLLSDFSIPTKNFLTSLLSFNLGVEIGQLIILAIALPFIYLFRRKTWYPKFIQIAAFLIAATGFIWFLERSFEVSIIS